MSQVDDDVAARLRATTKQVAFSGLVERLRVVNDGARHETGLAVEVLTELSVHEVGLLQRLLPIAIRLELIHEDGTLFAAVATQIALAVSLHVQPIDKAAVAYRILPDPGVHRASLPLDVPRKSDIYRNQSRHATPPRYQESPVYPGQSA